jgi:uncharacterized protein (DUF427 family)
MDGGITIQPFPNAVTVRFHDVVVASTEKALELREPGHDPVLYIPFDDIYFVHLERTPSHTECPWKGTASYWRINGAGDSADDAMWAYEEPKAEVGEIAGHGAFDPRKVTFEGVEGLRQVMP